MYLVRKTGRKCMNVDIDKYCSIMEFPFTRILIILKPFQNKVVIL